MNIYNNQNILSELEAIKRQLRDTQKLIKTFLDSSAQQRKGKKLDNYLLVNDVAERLGLHMNTIYRYMREEGLPFTRVGRTRYIREDDLVALLERQILGAEA